MKKKAKCVICMGVRNTSQMYHLVKKTTRNGKCSWVCLDCLVNE